MGMDGDQTRSRAKADKNWPKPALRVLCEFAEICLAPGNHSLKLSRRQNEKSPQQGALSHHNKDEFNRAPVLTDRSVHHHRRCYQSRIRKTSFWLSNSERPD
jgi:hypothetical protein